jgi:hypothetical protein
MAHPLIGIHAALGEIGIFAFLWVFVELLNPTEERIKRAKIVACIGTILIFLSWLAGGYYYVKIYGPDVKPMIKEGPQPWAHKVVMETKEHVFLLLPILSLFTVALMKKHDLLNNSEARKSILKLCVLILLIGLSMAFMGYLISTGARTALEAKVI